MLSANYSVGADYTYGYDVAGNLVNNNGVTRTYNAANQMVNDGTNALTYDNNGNLTNDGVNAYTWDRANRMLTAPGSTSYKYDGLSNRIQQTVSSVVTDYLNDVQPGLVKLLRQDDGSNVDHYVHAVRGIHSVDDATDWMWYAQDGLGSVRGLVDNAAVVQTTHEYDPYGNYIGTAPTGSYIGFTGEQTAGNGQVYLRARYYNPDMATFTALDPFEGIMQRPMSLNGYSWVEGNVPNWTDASGLCPTGYKEAVGCLRMRDELSSWGVNVVWDNNALNTLTCVGDFFIEEAVSQQSVLQRWTPNEMWSIYNAFRIFDRAKSSLSISYTWPLNNPIILKKTQAGIPEGDFAVTSGRDISFSPTVWGEASQNIEGFSYVTDAAQYRAWVALHEFSHIFTLDRAETVIQAMIASPRLGFPIIGSREYIETYMTQEVDILGFRVAYPPPTDYALSPVFNNVEYIIEAVTGTLWNAGYNSVSGYDTSAGGRTGGNFANVANIIAQASSLPIEIYSQERTPDDTSDDKIYTLPLPIILAGTTLSDWARIRIIDGIVEGR